VGYGTPHVGSCSPTGKRPSSRRGCRRRTYRLLAARNHGGELAGLAIYRLSEWPLSRSLLPCDWLVPDDETDAGATLLEGLIATARIDLARTVIALFPEWSPWRTRFQRRGFGEHATDYHLVTGSYSAPQYTAGWVRENWWYQPLDLDLV
jgi:hypothetical protein